jgi:hypothetical protein
MSINRLEHIPLTPAHVPFRELLRKAMSLLNVSSSLLTFQQLSLSLGPA